MTEQYIPASHRVRTAQYLASRRTGKLVHESITLSMSYHHSCINRRMPSTGQARHHRSDIICEQPTSSSASFEAITLCNDCASENKTSCGSRPCFVLQPIALVVRCCCGSVFSNIHHILQRFHLVLAVILIRWQVCHYFLSEYDVAAVLVHGSLLACGSCRLSSLGLITSHRLTTFATNTPY